MNLGILFVTVYDRSDLPVAMVTFVLCGERGTAGVRYSIQ